MWQLLLLSLLCGGPALARKISVQSECIKGATYWCNNLMTAIQCGALEHCVEAGWNRATKEDTCADCKQLATILIRMAKESSFKTSIQQYLEQECRALPLQTLVPRCQDLVDTYYADFITSLEGQLTPGKICGKLGLCPSDPLGSEDILAAPAPVMEQLLQGQAPTLPSSHAQASPREQLPIPLPTCWLCRTFVGKMESAIPKAAIGKAISKLCLVTPGAIAGMCQCLMEKYTVIIVDMIMGKLGPQLICGMMLMCATEENCGPEIPPAPFPAPTPGCQACLAITSRAKAALKTNSSRAEVEAALLTTCSSSFLDWQECKSFINQHQPKLFTTLTKPWSVQTTCQELGACMAAEKPFPAAAAACAQGPTYWCSSPSAAEQCKAVHHCQAHGWL
ncbi:pulmonary surfactant-associated protein B [Elgaria multicarinata webbii]|uniref:pulmonary surfactant-associated protein B n=1 Tax=Elgaria multicarinata webbii TaxID=159646 RepID=UPI002FCCEBC9